MNLVALVLLILHLFIVSCVDAGTVVLMNSNITRSFEDMEAYFSPLEEATVETGVLYVADPLDACQKLRNKPKQSTNGTFPFALIVRGGCSFKHKVRNAQGTGFKAAIVHDDVDRDFLLANGDEYGINIQAVFVSKAAGETLKKYAGLAETRVMLVPSLEDSGWSTFASITLVISMSMFFVLTICVFIYRRCISRRNNISQFHVMSHRMVKSLPSVTFTSVRGYITTALSCAICLEDYRVGDKLRVLPCCHKFHATCVDMWLTSWRTFCPVCKRDARTSTDEPSDSESTPLLRSSMAGTSLVNIDPPPVGCSPLHTSSSYSQQSFRYSSHESWPSPINVRHISADFEQQAASSSQRSYITCIGSLDSPFYSNISSLNEIMPPYQTSPSNASPRFAQSTSHRFNSFCRELEGSSSYFTSAHSLEEC